MEITIPEIQDLSLKDYLQLDRNQASYNFYHKVLKTEYEAEIKNFRLFLKETFTLLGIIYFNYESMPFEVSEYFEELNKKRKKENTPIVYAFQYDLIWGFFLDLTMDVKTLKTGEKVVDDNPHVFSNLKLPFLFAFYKPADQVTSKIKGKKICFVNDLMDDYHGFYDDLKYFYNYNGVTELKKFFHSLFNPHNKKIDKENYNKSLLFNGKKMNLSERIEIANQVLNFDEQIRKLNISDKEKYQLMAYILGNDVSNVRNVINGTRSNKIREKEINNYLNDIKK